MKNTEHKKRGRPMGRKNKSGYTAMLEALSAGESVILNADHRRASGWLKSKYKLFSVSKVWVIEKDTMTTCVKITKKHADTVKQ